jgi:FKBP-type peptidyl-prolyl cis-trans isomerase
VGAALLSLAVTGPATAFEGFKKDLTPARKRNKVDLSLYSDGPEGLKYYDVRIGNGPEVVPGDRVVIHYEAKWRGITFVTSRQGVGVNGGEPFGFNVGAKGVKIALLGLDLGVRGMQKGGQRKLSLPPALAYGDRGTTEIPPGATLDIEVELLSIKDSPMGFQVKLVEG